MRSCLAVLAVCAGCSFQAGAAPTKSDAGRADTHNIDAVIHDSQITDAPADTPAPVGLLSVTVQTMGTQDIDLSAEGTMDWIHWGLLNTSSVDRKSGANFIGNLTSTPPLNFSGAPLTASWAGGTPHATTSHTTTGVGAHQGTTLTFTVPADTATHTLRIYAGVQLADAHLALSLSDNSAPAAAKDLSDTNGTTNVRYTITFNSATAGQTLTVSWSDTNDHGGGSAFDALMSATLQ